VGIYGTTQLRAPDFGKFRLHGRRSPEGSHREQWAQLPVTWDDARKLDETDETGLKTSYGYDAMDRVVTMDREAIGTAVPAQHTEFEYDGDNRLRFTRIGPPAGERLISESRYDTGGRVKKTTTSDGVATDYSYIDGGREVDVVYFSGTSEAAAKKTKYFTDGQVKEVTGSAVVPEYHDYDFDTLGRPIVTVHLADAPRRNQTSTYDLLGRVVQESHAASVARELTNQSLIFILLRLGQAQDGANGREGFDGDGNRTRAFR